MALRLVPGSNHSPIALSIFDAVLDRTARRQLESLTTLTETKRGQILAKEGEVSDHFLVVVDGMIKLLKALPDNRQQIVAFRGPGDPVTQHRCNTPWPTTAQAVTTTTVYKIDWDGLRHLARRHPLMNQALYDLSCDEITNLQNRALTLGRKTSGERLASFILEFCSPYNSLSNLAREVQLPMRRSEIADYLGLTTESVSREFSHLKHQQIITMPRPSRIVVLNRPSLENIALGMPGAKHEEAWPSLAES